MKAISIRSKALACVAISALLLSGCNQAHRSSNNQPTEPASLEVSADASDMASDPSGEKYKANDISPVHTVADAPVSTFAVDVDTGAYANVRRFLKQGQLPPKDAVR